MSLRDFRNVYVLGGSAGCILSRVVRVGLE